MVLADGVWGPGYERLQARHRVRRLARPATPADVTDADALVVRNRTRVDRALLAAAPGLVIVARAGAGLDNIDVAAADELGVVVAAAPGVNAVSVAEHTIGLALALARRTVALDRSVRSGGWDRTPGRELTGGVWGLIAAGATGRATGRLAAALGMTVIGYDPYLDPDDPRLAAAHVRLGPLQDVLAADVISVHLPATPETAGLVGEDLLSRVRPGALLINVGRGDTLDEAALVRALRVGRLAGAALDVRTAEPPAIGELEGLPNVLLTPHIAGITDASQARIADVVREALDAVLSGGAAPNPATRADRPRRRGAR